MKKESAMRLFLVALICLTVSPVAACGLLAWIRSAFVEIPYPNPDMTLAAFLAQHPQESKIVEVDKVEFDFDWENSSDNEIMIVHMMSDRPFATANAWCDKNTPLGKSLWNILKDGDSHRMQLLLNNIDDGKQIRIIGYAYIKQEIKQ